MTVSEAGISAQPASGVPPLALVLAGGNALGAFEAGALTVLARRGRRPAMMAGTSIGAINAALFLGAKDGDPVATLRRFWSEAALDLFGLSRRQEEHWASILSLIGGRPNLSRSHLGAFVPFFDAGEALQDAAPLRATLHRLIDFDRLAAAGRFWVGAVALDPDEVRCFDSAESRIEADHLLASAALPVLFPPVVIEGRAYVDGGLAVNLPVLPIAEAADGPLDCIALDLYATGGAPPRTIGGAAERLQNLIFGLQSTEALAWARAAAPQVRYLHLPYRPDFPESAGKALDFSRRSIERRWAAGEAAMAEALDRLADGQGSG